MQLVTSRELLQELDDKIQQLKNGSTYDRCRAAEYLGKFTRIYSPIDTGGREVDPLIQSLNDPEESVRLKAIEALVFIDDNRAVEPLMACLNNDKESVAAAAAEALGKFRDPRAIEPLLMKIGPAYNPLTNAARNAVDQYPDKEPAAAVLRRLWETGSDDDRLTCIKISGRLGPAYPVLSYLLAAADASWFQMRAAAIRSLVHFHQKEAVATLAKKLKDPDARIRFDAARTLGFWDDPEVVQMLLEALGDQSPQVRAEVIDCLSRLKNNTGLIGHISPALKDPVWTVRLAAVKGLQRINHPKTISTLQKALKDSHPEVRLQGVKILKYSRTPWAVALFLKALRHADRPKSLLALHNMDFIRDESIAWYKIDLKDTGKSGAGAMDIPRLRSLAIRTWRRFLRDKSFKIRLWAVKELKQIKGRKATKYLCKALGDPNPRVRREAADVAHVYDAMRQLRILAKALASLDNHIRLAAVQVVEDGRFDPAHPLARHYIRRRLLQLRKDPDPRVRKCAQRAAESDYFEELTASGLQHWANWFKSYTSLRRRQ